MAKQKHWTVMVYMVASNDAELDTAAGRDLSEMVRGLQDDNDNNDNKTRTVDLVVQIKRHWPNEPQRLQLANGRLVPAADQPEWSADAGESKTLRDFVGWAQEVHSADKYLLILWGHSFGLGFGRDHGDALTISELADALRPGAGGKGKCGPTSKIDLLAANACAMSYVEAAYELREVVHYMVASQIGVPYAGWPYETVMRKLQDLTLVDRANQVYEVGRFLRDSYVASLPGVDVQMSLLNLSHAGALKDSLAALTKKIVDYVDESPDRAREMRDVFLSARAGDVRPLVDAGDLIDRLKGVLPVDNQESTAGVAVADVVGAFKGALNALLVGPTSGSQRAVKEPQAANSNGLTGVGIFVPVVTTEEDLLRLELVDPRAESDRPANEYRRLALFKGFDSRAEGGDSRRGWPELVYRTLAAPMSPVLSKAFEGTGATARADRMDIANILTSIDACFNLFERAVRDERQRAERLGEDRPLPSRNELLNLAAPALPLLEPLSVAQVALLKRAKVNETSSEAKPSDEQGLLVEVKRACKRLEDALGRVEDATFRGLTEARLGLGPLDPTGLPVPFVDGRFSKPSDQHGAASALPGDDRRLSAGTHKPSDQHGAPDAAVSMGRPGDLRLDLALVRVTDLFGRVATALEQVEGALADTEAAFRDTFLQPPAEYDHSQTNKLVKARVTRGLKMVEEAARNARFTVHQVLIHPVYGIGPGGPGLGLAERRALARAGGFSVSRLRLLTID